VPKYNTGVNRRKGGKFMESKGLPRMWLEAKEIFRKRKEQGEPEFSTGLDFLDNVTDGLQKGEVWIIAGHTGAGKTCLALNMAQAAAEKPEHHILFCSLEMKGWELSARLFCSINGVNYSDIRKGMFPENFNEQDKIFQEYLSRIDFEIYEWGYTFKQITEILEKGYKKVKPDIIFIDFIQLIEWMSFKDERIALTEYIRKLAELAKTQNIGIVIVSQFRRLPAGAKYNRAPDLIDLKGTGALEQLSAKVIFTYAEEESGVKKHYIHLAKNRQGPCIKKEVIFKGWMYKFEEIREDKETKDYIDNVKKTFKE